MDGGSQATSYAGPADENSRKKSIEEPAPDRAIKHRSSKACQSCRARKVRCDITTNVSRCTNCRLDSLACIVVPSRRGKNNRARRKKIPSGSEDPSSTGAEESVRRESYVSRDGGNEPVPMVVTFDEESDNLGSEGPPEIDDRIRRQSENAMGGYDELMTPQSASNGMKQNQSHAARVPLPAFIAPLSNRIPQEDIDFLILKGATDIPEPELYCQILRSYLFSVHAFMPLLDLRAFVPAVLDNREDGRVSLLLFQAVMFAGLHALPLEAIHELGFEGAKHAREVLFNRARLLYEFDVEPDSLAICQSLILMSTWYGKWDERRHTWHYTGLAYDMARNLGLHREPSARHPSDKTRRLRRKTWWSLYIRDRMIALGTRRPLRIRDDDINVAMLTLDDFDLDLSIERHRGKAFLPSIKEGTSMVLMCVELAKLCQIIGRITSSQYTTLNADPETSNTMMVVPRRDGGGTKQLESCDRELNEWFKTLSSNVRRHGFAKMPADPHNCVEVQWAVLNLTYLTVVNVLHRSQAIKPLLDENARVETAQDTSRSKMKEAARGLTKLSQTMLRHDQIRFVGTIGVTALVAASLSHMLDISSGNEDVRDASTLRLYQSLEVLNALTASYASADAAVSFLTSVTRKAGISLPVQINAPEFNSTESIGSNSMEQPLSAQNSVESTVGHQDLSSSHLGVAAINWQAPVSQNYNAANEYPQSPTRLDGKLSVGARNNLGGFEGSATDSHVGSFTTAVAPPPVQESLASHQHPQLTSQYATTTPVSHYIDQGSHGVAVPPGTESFNSFMWDNAMNMGMNFEPTAFTYDFYSDAFGFLDGRYPGTQQ